MLFALRAKTVNTEGVGGGDAHRFISSPWVRVSDKRSQSRAGVNVVAG